MIAYIKDMGLIYIFFSKNLNVLISKKFILG